MKKAEGNQRGNIWGFIGIQGSGVENRGLCSNKAREKKHKGSNKFAQHGNEDFSCRVRPNACLKVHSVAIASLSLNVGGGHTYCMAVQGK